MAISCIVCEIYRSELLVENREIFIPHLYLAPPEWWPRRNFAKMYLIIIKPEWLGYRMVKKLWRYVKSFRYNTAIWRTDRRTDRQSSYINIALLCWRTIMRGHRSAIWHNAFYIRSYSVLNFRLMLWVFDGQTSVGAIFSLIYNGKDVAGSAAWRLHNTVKSKQSSL